MNSIIQSRNMGPLNPSIHQHPKSSQHSKSPQHLGVKSLMLLGLLSHRGASGFSLQPTSLGLQQFTPMRSTSAIVLNLFDHVSGSDTKRPNNNNDINNIEGVSENLFENEIARPLETFNQRISQLTSQFEASQFEAQADHSKWSKVAVENFDLLTVLLGYRAGCSVPITGLPKGVNVGRSIHPILEIQGKTLFSDVVHKQLFIFDQQSVEDLFQKEGLSTLQPQQGTDAGQSGKVASINKQNTLWSQFDAFSPSYFQIQQKERALGLCHGIDPLNTDCCSSYLEYLVSSDLIVTHDMLDYAATHKMITPAEADLLSSIEPDSRLAYRFSESNRGIRLPMMLVKEPESEGIFSEFDLEPDEEDLLAFEVVTEENLKDKAAISALPSKTVQAMENLYRSWERTFEPFTRMQKSLPKAEGLDEKFMGRRKFVETEAATKVDKDWQQLFDHFKLTVNASQNHSE